MSEKWKAAKKEAASRATRKRVRIKSAQATMNKFEPAIRQSLDELDNLIADMRRDQEEINQIGAETRSILAKLSAR